MTKYFDSDMSLLLLLHCFKLLDIWKPEKWNLGTRNVFSKVVLGVACEIYLFLGQQIWQSVVMLVSYEEGAFTNLLFIEAFCHLQFFLQFFQIIMKSVNLILHAIGSLFGLDQRVILTFKPGHTYCLLRPCYPPVKYLHTSMFRLLLTSRAVSVCEYKKKLLKSWKCIDWRKHYRAYKCLFVRVTYTKSSNECSMFKCFYFVDCSQLKLLKIRCHWFINLELIAWPQYFTGNAWVRQSIEVITILFLLSTLRLCMNDLRFSQIFSLVLLSVCTEKCCKFNVTWLRFIGVL